MEDIEARRADLERGLAELEHALSQAAQADPVEGALAAACLERLREECEAVRAELQALNAAARPPKKGRRHAQAGPSA